MICLLCFGQVQLPSTGRAGDRVHCPHNNFTPLANTDTYICMKFIRNKRASHVNGTENLKKYGGGFLFVLLILLYGLSTLIHFTSEAGQNNNFKIVCAKATALSFSIP